MDSFLKLVAQQILTENPEHLEQVTVVFNNRRSGLFLKKQFIKQLDKATFLPNIIGIDDLVSQLGELRIMPNEFLLYELYDIHRNLEGQERKFETFEEFISFGDMMIADFSELDSYRVNAEDLFGNLHDLKEIGEWNISGEKLSSFQEKYLHFYKSLYQYYTQLKDRLQNGHMAYSGMAYRYVAEHIDSMIDKIDCKTIYFVGFNALSACEEMIIKAFVNQKNGHIITDGDSYYVNDEKQEAGKFLRKHKELFGKEYKEHFNQPKRITIVSCPENVLQTKYAGKCLSQWSDEESQLEQTAIVLSDEGLLMPMLNSLPDNIKSANITMGFPFTNSEAHAIMLKLFSLYSRVHNDKFYHQDILDVLSDYLITNLLGTKNIRSAISQYLIKNTIIYATLEQLKDLANEIQVPFDIIEFLFENTHPSPDEFLRIAQTLTIKLYEADSTKSNIKEKEALGNLLETIKYFIKLQQQYQTGDAIFVNNLNTLQKIYTRIAQRRTIAFYGEPLSGLQILGVLETRNLDFKKVIMLSVNEGTIPSGRGNNTLIPLQLKKNFGIPTYNEKDAVYAYHFYRFLQRAEDIYLVYNTESDSFGKGEASRFIMQIRDELKAKYPENIEIYEKVVSIENKELPTLEPQIGKKTPAIMKKLEEIANDSGFSPSALNTFRNCPLKFYYEKLLNIREPDTVNEELGNDTLGTLIHKVLEVIYNRDADKHIRIQTLQDALKNIDKEITTIFDEQFQHGLSHEGKNYLMQSVAKVQITNFLKKEIELLKNGTNIEIVLTEEKLKHPLNVEINGENKIVNIQGTADRIDYIYQNDDNNKLLRIVDYKTGKVTAADLKVDRENNVPDKLFQVMTYLWIYCRQHKHNGAIQSGIYPLQNLNEGFMPGIWNKNTNLTIEDINDFVENELSVVIKNIMDPNQDFLPNEKSKLCKYCPMNNVCQNA